MRRLSAVIGLIAVFLTSSASSQSTRHTPVLVELFTSEGCESCPPADEILMRFARQRTVGVTDVVLMSEHVDYWNYLGWRDPFSARQFTSRQEDYGRAFGGDIYTPQVVVDGQYDVLGSNYDAVTGAIARASSAIKGTVATTTHWRADAIDLHVATDPVKDPANVYLAVTEDNLSNKALRGENKGRTLSHAAVVRQLTLLGSSKANTAYTGDHVVHLRPEWKPSDVRLIVFTQSTKSRAVLAISQFGLPSSN